MKSLSATSNITGQELNFSSAVTGGPVVAGEAPLDRRPRYPTQQHHGGNGRDLDQVRDRFLHRLRQERATCMIIFRLAECGNVDV